MRRSLPALILCLFWVFPCFAQEKAESDPIGSYIYQDEGIEVTGPESVVDFDIGGRINYDLGYIVPERKALFPQLCGFCENYYRWEFQ